MTPDGDRSDRAVPTSGITVECLTCGRVGSFAGAHAAAELPLVQLTKRLRCSECGSRAVRAKRAASPQDVARVLRGRMSPGRG